MELQPFLDAADAAGELALEADVEWRAWRLSRGALHAGSKVPRAWPILPPRRPFGRSRRWLAGKGLGFASAALRSRTSKTPDPLRGRLLLLLGRPYDALRDLQRTPSHLRLARLLLGDVAAARPVPIPAGFWTRVVAGWRALERRRPTEAVAAFSAAYALDPACAWTLVWRARAHEDAGEHAAAAADREQAVRMDPAALWSYAKAARQTGVVRDPASVIMECDRRLAADPKDALALALRGESRDQHDRVVADLSDAIALEPGRAWFHASLARVLLYKGETVTALASIDRAIALDAACGWFYAWRGEIRRRQDDHRGALQDQDQAIRLDPFYPRAWCWRGSLKRLQGDTAGAVADLDAGLELDPDYAWGHNERALALGRKPSPLPKIFQAATYLKRPETLERLDLFRALSLKDLGSGLRRARLLRRLGRHEEACADCDRLLALDPADAGAYRERARNRRALGREQDAVADERAAQAHAEGGSGPRERAALEGPARARLLAGDAAGVVADLSRAASLHPRDAWFFFLQAEALAAVGRAGDADAALKRALEILPDYAEALLLRERLRQGQAA